MTTHGELDRQRRIDAVGFDYEACPKTWVPACDPCGGSDWLPLASRDRYGFRADSVICPRCGLVAINPRPTPDGYRRFYERFYRPLVSAYHGRLIDTHTLQAEQRPYAAGTEGLLRPFLADRRGGTLLDIGGSTGVVAAHLASAFELTPTVLDPAPDELLQARAFGVEVLQGFVEDWEPSGRTFDVVVLLQTIDHLLEPQKVLRKLREVLSPTGILLLDIVNFHQVALRDGSIESALKIDHPFNWSHPVIDLLLRRTGFRILQRSTGASPHLVAYVCATAEPQRDAVPQAGWAEELLQSLRKLSGGHGT